MLSSIGEGARVGLSGYLVPRGLVGTSMAVVRPVEGLGPAEVGKLVEVEGLVSVEGLVLVEVLG
jgi:hypothetical protein